MSAQKLPFRKLRTFYSVNGYDPEFMLCTKAANGVVTTYICNNGITLKYGKELYEDRLHLSENITGVQYESRMSWYQSIGEKYELDIEEAFIQEFISQLDTEEFLLCRDVAEQEGWEHMADSEIYHMYFMMNNGTKIHLRLHENGYVRFQGLTDLCVKVPADCYDKLLDTFTRNKGTPVTDIQEGMETSYEDMLADPQLGKYCPPIFRKNFNWSKQRFIIIWNKRPERKSVRRNCICIISEGIMLTGLTQLPFPGPMNTERMAGQVPWWSLRI